MIVIINGPLGIGKTETSWQLFYSFPKAVMLDMDHVVAVHPFDYYDQTQLDYAYSTAGAIIAHHVRHGYTDFVVNWVFESAEQITRFKHELSTFGLPIAAFRLKCVLDEIARRIRARARREPERDIQWETDRARELGNFLEAAAEIGDLGTVINTTDLTVAQTVDAIRQHPDTCPEAVH